MAQGTPDCSPGKGLQACVKCMILLASSNGGHFLLIGSIAQPLCELCGQPPPADPSLKPDFPPFTVQVTGYEAAKVAKHSASEQHLLPWVQIKDHARTSSSSPTLHFPG